MDVRDRTLEWAADPYFDPETRKAATAIASRPEEMLAAFGSELTFGTGGLRGIVGTGTARMNRYTVARATLGLARYLKSKNKEASVVIAHDSRHGSEEFTRVTAGVLAAEGIRALVFPALAPTPMLSYAVRSLGASAGVMITASHNPASYNGYKVYGADGCQITEKAAAAITAKISAAGYTDPFVMPESRARKAGLLTDVPDEVRRNFAQACLFCRPDPMASAPVHIVYTPLHGTGLLPVREVLGCMQGVTVTEVEAQCKPDGDFPTCPKPNPELDSALAMGLALCRETGADLLLATDPDCDRVGVAARDRDGQYRRFTGNEVGLMLEDYILRVKASQGQLSRRSAVVKTIVTSDLAFPIAKQYGAKVTEVLTGFKYIGEVIGKLENQGRENDFVLGFEESCGYLAGTHVRDKDGVMACMLVAEMAQACKARGETLCDLMDGIYARFGYLGTRLLSFDIAGAVPMETMAAVMTSLRAAPPEKLAGEAVTGVKDYLGGLDGLPASNVLTCEGNNVKAIIRPSGTEPKVKVYLSAKATSAEEAEALLDTLEKEISGRIRV